MAKKPTRKKDSSSNDRATAYALDVRDGKIIAGPHVRDACNRHLHDLKHAGKRGLYYDEAEAAEGIAFFEEILCLNGGQFEGKPFLLLPWQAFIIGNLYGWKRRADDTRRFRVAYIETAKGSGKSPLAAGIGLKGMVADNEPRAEIYAAATHKEQAKVLFRDALAFFDQSPALQSRLVASGTGDNRWNLAFIEKGSFFRVISSENKGKSGPRPHVGLLDEVHEHPNGDVIEMIRAGFKFRRQPMNVMITNSGHNMTSVCREYHDMGCQIAAQTRENDEFFAFICALDEADLADDSFLDDESCWEKANPSLSAGIPGFDYIRAQVREARGLPSKMSTVKRLNFCIWTEADDPWISRDVWMSAQDEDFDESLLLGRRCFAGLDLSSVLDLTAAGLLFDPIEEDPFYRLKVFFWIPGHELQQRIERDRVPYDDWRDRGFLKVLPGRAIDKAKVLQDLVGISERYDLQGIAYDRWRIEDLLQFAENSGIEMSMGKWNKDKREWDFADGGAGIHMLPFGQEHRSMSPAVDKFETMLVNGEIRHIANPVLTWNAANAVVTKDQDENRKVSKSKSIGRVDGIVTAVMACGVINEVDAGGSIYEQRGVITF